MPPLQQPFPWISAEEQARRLQALFRQTRDMALDASQVERLAGLCRKGIRREEGIAVTPKLCVLALAIQNVRWPKENAALGFFLRTVLKADTGKLTIEDNFADRELEMGHGPSHHKLTISTSAAYDTLEQTQPGDFMVFPVDMNGNGIRGFSPLEAYRNIIADGDFPIDVTALLSILYTHVDELGERILWYDAVGNQVSPKGDGRWDDTAYIDRRGRHHNVDWNWVERARSFRISPSGRLVG